MFVDLLHMITVFLLLVGLPQRLCYKLFDELCHSAWQLAVNSENTI